MILKKTTKAIVAIVLVLVILQLFVSSRLSAIGNNVANLEEQGSSLNQENKVLEQKIASASAFAKVEEKALKLGLQSKSEVLFLDDAVLVVQR
jgi:cell division protein FtsL